MSGISVPKGAWILVADFSKAILLENTGTPMSLRLDVRKVLHADENPPTHEQGDDAPGTVFAGSHRSHVEQTDWHAMAGRRFLETAAEALEAARTLHEVGSIVLVAPPKALAELRTIISASVKASVVGELDKDLVRMPVDEIAEHLAA